LTTPSGQVIGYTYSNHSITGITVNGIQLVTAVAEEPFGDVHGWTWGNGTAEIRSHDADGNAYQIGGPEVSTYGYDNAFRITGATNAANSALSWTYAYDAVDRITTAAKTSTTLGWTYDATNNRTAQTGSGASTFTTPVTSNQLGSVSGTLTRTYTYDSSGNPASYTGASFTYNNRSRLLTATVGGSTTTYLYDALGQRIQKSGGPAGTVVFVYDQNGHLTGEYSSTGVLIEETVWLGDIPVATIRPAGVGITTYYIHADNLGTPRIISRPSDNAIMWRWDADPYGSAAANSNPAGQGVFTYNLRFLGQYSDSESGLNYNYMRNYDPQIGRYAESDPAGLLGGLNTYAYANGDPVDNADPTGEFVPLIVILPAIGGLVGGISDVLSAGKCENKFAAFGRGFVSGAIGTLAGIGVITATGNPWLAGAAAGAVSQGLDQSIAGQYSLPNAVVGVVAGGLAGGVAAKALATVGRLPNLLTPRTPSNMGLNSLRMVGQETRSDVSAAVIAVAVSSNSSEECACKQN
jgi:RHS repeat-associated protein